MPTKEHQKIRKNPNKQRRKKHNNYYAANIFFHCSSPIYTSLHKHYRPHPQTHHCPCFGFVGIVGDLS